MMFQLLFKKTDENSAYKEFTSDPEFRRVVFSETEYCNNRNSRKVEEDTTKLGKLIILLRFSFVIFFIGFKYIGIKLFKW